MRLSWWWFPAVALHCTIISWTVAFEHSVSHSLCAVTAYFNPLQYTTRLVNLVEARQWSRRQGLFLVIVELGFGNDHFQLTGHVSDDELTRIVRLRTELSHVMWQKEALLNVGLKTLDAEDLECENVVWLDSDVLLEDGWIEAAEEMLKHNPIGQVFTHLIRLPQGVFSPFAFWSEPRMQRMGTGNREGQVQVAAAMGFGGHTGFAWAAKRSYLRDIGGLYDRCIVGGFDALLYHALNDPRCETRLNSLMQMDFDEWASRLGPHRAGFPSRTVKAAALWHGEIKDRTYQDRHSILLKHGYDPRNDVVLSTSNFALEWTVNASADLRRDVLGMFVQRKEDGQEVAISEEVLKAFEMLYPLAQEPTTEADGGGGDSTIERTCS